MAQDENVAAVRLMPGAGWPVNTLDATGTTALHWAGFHGNAALMRVLLAARPDLEVRERQFSGTPLNWLLHGSIHGWRAKTGDYVGALNLLLDAGAVLPTPT